MHPTRPRYASVAIVLHWVIAAGILFLIWLGWNMHGNEALYQLHKSIGISILFLTVARLVWRLMNPPPPLPAGMNRLEKTASHLVHIGFYALMLGMPLTGWMYVSTSYDFDVPTVLFGLISWPDIAGLGFLTNATANGVIEQIHSKLAWLALALLALHVAGALKHEFGDEQGVLKRILPGVPWLKGRVTAPEAVRGATIAFGTALSLFAAIAILPMLKSGVSASGGSELETGSDIAANWTVDHDQSGIAFRGVHDGNDYTGTFTNWSAQIRFDQADPAAAQIRVSVDTTSAQASKKLYTDSLKAAEWLNSTDFPTAEVRITDVKSTGENSYTSTAQLTLKGIRVAVPFVFTLTPQGDAIYMTGQAQLARGPLDLGQVSDPGADWVSEAVTVTATVLASPNR